MAYRAGADGGGTRSPQKRWVWGLIAAALLIGAGVIAFQFSRGDGDGTLPDPSPSGSAASGAAAITFGTALDPATDEVAANARTDRFSESDTFVYSVPVTGTVPEAVYVEVRLAGDPSAAAVQDPIDPQLVATTNAISFSVPAAALLTDFGAGEFRMLIYADPAAEPIAEGTFTLIEPDAAPTPSP